MPIYEYHCEGCGNKFEVLHRRSRLDTLDEEGVVCPACGKGPVKRLLSVFSSTRSNDSGSAEPSGCPRCGSDTPGKCMLE